MVSYSHSDECPTDVDGRVNRGDKIRKSLRCTVETNTTL